MWPSSDQTNFRASRLYIVNGIASNLIENKFRIFTLPSSDQMHSRASRLYIAHRYYQVLRQRLGIRLHRLELSAILEVANPKPSSALLHGGLLQIVLAYNAYMRAYVRVHAYIHTKQRAFPGLGLCQAMHA